MRTVLLAFTFSALAALVAIPAADAQTFYTPVSATTNTDEPAPNNDLWPVSNLIQGPGVGFDASAPHTSLAGGSAGAWVTAAPLGGVGFNYVDHLTPILEFDLGADTAINAISTWGYSSGNANGVEDFSLLFATEADGPGGFGTSIALNPSFTLDADVVDPIIRQSNVLGQLVNARYVQMTVTGNFFREPGDGTGGPPGLPGGDRVGLQEVSFTIPEPSTMALAGLGLILLSLIRRRK